jgi:hypothetical protein
VKLISKNLKKKVNFYDHPLIITATIARIKAIYISLHRIAEPYIGNENEPE